MSLDLSSLDALTANQETGVEIAIYHPVSAQPIGMYVTVAGIDSERVKKLMRELRNDALARQSRRITAEQEEANTFRLAVALVVSWRFEEGVTIDGEQPECTAKNVDAVLRRFPFIAEQVAEKATNRANFSKS